MVMNGTKNEWQHIGILQPDPLILNAAFVPLSVVATQKINVLISISYKKLFPSNLLTGSFWFIKELGVEIFLRQLVSQIARVDSLAASYFQQFVNTSEYL